MKLFVFFLIVLLAVQGMLATPSKDSRGGGQRGGSSGANGGRGGSGGNRGGAQHGGHGAGDRSGNSRVA
ncbi:hypothetical protein GWI33_022057 [Rhynchophorus ferrugineus]|uniref:Uncharacterized protein n=1 Tax=Rhynchophorus ferrugineus TaxID=354439 RepID=A0A834ISX3_RHYFE|nr:hypothetical protein GWI33_022057 [Rhynchophorus ferrugineus]